jgi:small GTP-binding protein
MIRDLLVIDLMTSTCKYQKSYTRAPVNPHLVTGFIGAMAGVIVSMPEGQVKSVPARPHKFTYAHKEGLIYVLSSDIDDPDEDLAKKLGNLLERSGEVVKKYLSLATPQKQDQEELENHIDRSLISEIKVALVGYGGTGKTTMFQLVHGTDIPLDYLPTMFVQYKKLDNRLAESEVLLWDFAGQQKFTPLWPMLLHGTNVILLVTDSTVENVLQTKRVFMSLIKKARPNAVVIGMANKQDLPNAMSAALVKKVLKIDEVYGLCAIDPSERRKLQNIIAHGIEMFLEREATQQTSVYSSHPLFSPFLLTPKRKRMLNGG